MGVSNNIKLVVLGILLFITLFIFILNPYCIVKTCLKNSEKWNPKIVGKYSGSASYPGATMNCKLNILGPSDKKSKCYRV